MYDIIELNGKLVLELKEIAKGMNIPKIESLKKADLIYKILDHQALNPSQKTLVQEQKNTKKPFSGRQRKNTEKTPIL